MSTRSRRLHALVAVHAGRVFYLENSAEEELAGILSNCGVCFIGCDDPTDKTPPIAERMALPNGIYELSGVEDTWQTREGDYDSDFVDVEMEPARIEYVAAYFAEEHFWPDAVARLEAATEEH